MSNSNKDVIFNQRIVVKNPPLLKCYCNDGGNCLKNKTCETEGFCYQRLVIQNKNGQSTKKLIKGCSSSKQIDFYYCTHSSNKTNLKCCSNNFCNNQSMELSYYNLGHILNFFIFMILAIVLIIIFTLIVRRYIKRRAAKKKADDIENARNRNKPKPYNQLEFVKLIKKGEFKQSFYGRRLGEKLFIKIYTEKTKESWLNEVEIYSLPLIRHENIVDFVGKDNLLIVTIFYEIGSLTDYLANNRNLNEGQLIRLMLSAAQGLNHLHEDLEFKPSIVHRNLSSNNYIVSSDEVGELKCKLTDFAEALTYTKFERLEREQKLKQLKNIVCDFKYCPPEYFNQKLNFKSFLAFQAADAYSLSLVLWQIANHQGENQSSTNRVEQSNRQVRLERSNKFNQLERFDSTDESIRQATQSNLSPNEQNENNSHDSRIILNEANLAVENQDPNSDQENNLSLKKSDDTEDQADIEQAQSNETISRQEENFSDDEIISQNNLEKSARYGKPYEEYLMHDDKRSEYVQMKELLKDDSFTMITRPTIEFDASKVRTFNGDVIPKLIDDSWSYEPSARLSVARIVKDLTNLYNSHLIKINKK